MQLLPLKKVEVVTCSLYRDDKGKLGAVCACLALNLGRNDVRQLLSCTSILVNILIATSGPASRCLDLRRRSHSKTFSPNFPLTSNWIRNGHDSCREEGALSLGM